MTRLNVEGATHPGATGAQPLIGIFLGESGREVACYFANEAEARAALPADSIQDALSLAGAWSDLDWDEAAAALDRIRHESPPSPPLTL